MFVSGLQPASSEISITYSARGFIFVHRIFPDLEDFLLNLDKDSPYDDPPYSW